MSLQISNTFPLEIRVSNAEYMKKILENKIFVSKQEQKELEMQIEIEKQLEQEKQLEIEKKKKEKQLEIEKKIKEKEIELKKSERREKEKEKRRKKKEELDRKEKEQFYNNILEKITDLTSIYDEIRINDIEKKLPEVIKNRYRAILEKDLITLIEEMILNADINARIRGDFLTFIKNDLKAKPKQQKLQYTEDILISRGGDWKIENNQSVFNYKVKVKNSAKFVLTNIQILLTSIPSGLISQSDKYLIDILNPDSFESPTFKFSAKESCVGDKVKDVVIYTNFSQQILTDLRSNRIRNYALVSLLGWVVLSPKYYYELIKSYIRKLTIIKIVLGKWLNFLFQIENRLYSKSGIHDSLKLILN